MKITLNGDTLSVSDINELATATANSFRSEFAALPKEVRRIDIDLAATHYVDCGGLGALIALWKTAGGRNGATHIRVLNAPRAMRHMWNLLKLDRVLPIEGNGI